MDRIKITGGRSLKGEIRISGAKNAALPLMAASLLTDETLRLTNLPHLADIATMVTLLTQHGVEANMNGDALNDGHAGRVLDLTAGEITNTLAPYDLVRKMRASILVLGPLLARMGHAEVSLPGGCAIGTRPVDLHLSALEKLGAEIQLKDGYIRATAPKGLRGADITFPYVSVGATENLLTAAALAEGRTRLFNAAREPEVTDLAACLIGMGAEIHGLGSDCLTVHGRPRLSGYEHRIIPDRIESGTYAMAAAMTDGELELVGARRDHLESVIDCLGEAGIDLVETNLGLRVKRANGRLQAISVETSPFPDFPTDLQAQLMALAATAKGTSRITESIFENRFMHVPELSRMGADIHVDGAVAEVHGRNRLTGAPVMATDLRASFSLVLAGLFADGETLISRVYHLDRGYEAVESKLMACGAVIERIK
jgi:UDP-N-acetylglucosamine 1-carboxyvinyltransferase